MEEFGEKSDENTFMYVNKKEKDSFFIKTCVATVVTIFFLFVVIAVIIAIRKIEWSIKCEDINIQRNSFQINSLQEYNTSNSDKEIAINEINQQIAKKYNVAYCVAIGVFVGIFIVFERPNYKNYKLFIKPEELKTAKAKCIRKGIEISNYFLSVRIYATYYLYIQLPNMKVVEKYFVTKDLYDKIIEGNNVLISKNIYSNNEIDGVYLEADNNN